jgi:hypothetical protein
LVGKLLILTAQEDIQAFDPVTRFLIDFKLAKLEKFAMIINYMGD